MKNGIFLTLSDGRTKYHTDHFALLIIMKNLIIKLVWLFNQKKYFYYKSRNYILDGAWQKLHPKEIF